MTIYFALLLLCVKRVSHEINVNHRFRTLPEILEAIFNKVTNKTDAFLNRPGEFE